jgi:hypothetical protein
MCYPNTAHMFSESPTESTIHDFVYKYRSCAIKALLLSARCYILFVVFRNVSQHSAISSLMVNVLCVSECLIIEICLLAKHSSISSEY